MDSALVDTALTDTFRGFVMSERFKYSDENNNRVAFSLAQVGRYLRICEIARLRYQSAFQTVSAAFEQSIQRASEGSRELSQDEIEELDRSWRHDLLLHMEIESYFLFVSILLDRVSQCIEDFFGVVSRSLTLNSHNKCRKNLAAYAAAKELAVPSNMVSLAESLYLQVTSFRDKHITHLKNPRATHATMFHPERGAQMAVLALYPKDTDLQQNSPSIPELRDEIEQYVSMFIDVISNNREKSRYA